MMDSGGAATGLAAAALLILILRLVRRDVAIDSLIWWPILLYIPGPGAIFLLFADHAAFGNYFSRLSVFWATLGFVLGIALYFITLSKPVCHLLEQNLVSVRASALSNGNLLPLYALGIICMGAQAILMAKTGASIASGAYVLGGGAFEENSALFTFSAGLYEIFAALAGFRLLAVHDWNGTNRRFLLFTGLVLALRMFGGTRLIILKLVAFSLLLAYVTGRIQRRTVLLSGASFAALLMLVGNLRSGDGEDVRQLAFLLLAEPALGSLSATFVTDFAIDKGDWFNPGFLADAVGYAIFVMIHLLPTAIYSAMGGTITLLGDWGYYRTAAAPFYPFATIIAETGVETVSPVGGQSLIALGVAIFGVAGAALIVPAIIGGLWAIGRALTRFVPIMLIVAFEAPSIFRDSTEIFVKQVFVISVGYWIFELLARMKIPTPSALMPAKTTTH